MPIRGVYLAARGSEIHLFFSDRLRHLVSHDSGRSWEALSYSWEDSSWRAYTCGLRVRDDHVIDMVALRARRTFGVGPASLIGLQWKDGIPGPSSEIDALPDAFPEQPMPVIVGDSLGEATFVGFNHAPRVPVSGVGDGITVDGGILLATRPETTWSVSDVVAGEVSARIARLEDAIGTIGGVAVLSDSNVFGVFYQSDQPYFVRRLDPSHWAEPERVVSGRKNRDQNPDLRLLFHPNEHRGYLAWIDATRQRHSYRFIFIDSWVNNDLALSPIKVRRDGKVVVGSPAYLTRSPGFVRHLQLVTSGGHDYVVWMGKERVGKTVESGHSPVELVARRLD